MNISVSVVSLISWFSMQEQRKMTVDNTHIS